MSSKLSRALGFAGSFRDEVARVLRLDSWVNTITGLGGSRDRTQRAEVKALCPLQPIELEALYHSNDLAAKIVDRRVRDAMRQGFDVAGDDGALAAALRAWKVGPKVAEADIWGRLYGGGAVLLGMSERLGLPDEPLDLAKMQAGDLQYLLVLDRLALTIEDTITDRADPEFGEVRTYRISTTGETGDQVLSGSLVHASRLVFFGGALTSERVKARYNAGFDLSVLQRPHDILRDADQSWRSVMLLIQDLSQAVFAVDGLIDMIAEGEADTMYQRMEVVDMSRSVARAVVIDAESERFEHKGAVNVTGVPPLLLLIFQRLAAAADMPMTIFLGMSPGGMNATGESDTRGWYDVVQSERDDRLAPGLQILARVVGIHEGIDVDESPEIVWPPLWQPTPSEKADLDKKDAETDKIRIDSGVLEPEEVTLAKFQDDPIYKDVIDFAGRESALQEPDPEPPPTLIPDPNAPPPAPDPNAPPPAPPELPAEGV